MKPRRYYGSRTINPDAFWLIVDDACSRYQVERRDLFGYGRTKAVCDCRAEICYLARTRLGAGYYAISRIMNLHRRVALQCAMRHAQKIQGMDGLTIHKEPKPKSERFNRTKAERERRRAERAERDRAIDEAIARLSESGARNLALHEIAAATGVSRATIGNIERDAIRKMRYQLERDPYIIEWMKETKEAIAC